MKLSFVHPVLLVAAAATAAAACNRSDAKATDASATEAVVAIPLHTVELRPAPDRLTLTGTVMARESSDVTASVPGKVLTVLVDRGSRVKFGDPLLRLDASSAALSAQSIRAQLAASQAQEQLARDECRRAQQLLDKGAITRSQYEREMTSCTAAAQNVAATRAQLQLASKSVTDGVVRAPFAGVVTQRNVSPGEWVGPGVPLLTLVDDDPMHVDLSVPEAWVPRVREDQLVVVQAVAYPDLRFGAQVTRVGSEIGRVNRALIAEARLAPGTPLVPGMFAEATITVGTSPMPVVPRTAVVRRGNTWRLFAVVKGRLEERVVQLGPQLPGDGIAILRGVSAGEKVAARVGEQVVDGIRVE
jgi:membrane fusion protein (multidrug efflux system)